MSKFGGDDWKVHILNELLYKRHDRLVAVQTFETLREVFLGDLISLIANLFFLLFKEVNIVLY